MTEPFRGYSRANRETLGQATPAGILMERLNLDFDVANFCVQFKC